MSKIPIVVAVGDVDLLRTLERRLTGAGFTVLTCCDSETAFDLIMRHKPALLLADWEMPGVTGVKLCRKIRESEFNANVYVIILAPPAAEAPIVAGLEAGADDYLTRPASDAELVARVQAGIRLLLEREKQAAELNEAKERLCREIKERERTQGLLSRIQMALDDSGEAIAIVDEDGKVGYINISFADLFHCTLDTINEAGLESLFVDRTTYTSILNSTAGGDNWSGQAQMLSGKERRFPAEIRAASVVNERIEIAGLMLLVNDITERKRLENIPRLNAIAQIVGRQQESFWNEKTVENLLDRDRTSLGVQLLKVAMDLDELLASGVPFDTAWRKMSGRSGQYNPEILDALMSLRPKETPAETREVCVRELEIGMIADADIRAKDGSLLVSKGGEITYPVLLLVRSMAETAGVTEPLLVKTNGWLIGRV